MLHLRIEKMLTESELRALPIGARVVLPMGADAYPDFLLTGPLFGTIDEIADDAVWIKLDTHKPELDYWDNRIQCWYWDDAPSHDVMPLWRYEFPDYPIADMPDVPDTWKDVSWHNDTCPSFETPSGNTVYIDRAIDADREMPGAERFHIMGADGVLMTSTDDWIVALMLA